MTSATATPASETRFAFGENWLRYLEHVDEARIERAERSLRETFGVDDLTGKTFLDAGAGSGLFSLAATRLSAERVHSFDYDPDSVACAAQLKERFAPGLESWSIESGDLTDPGYCAALGKFDVVYCFGVVHSTGAMWRALDHVAEAVAAGGLMFVSVYNDQEKTSDRWRKVKWLYNRLPHRIRPVYAALAWAPWELWYGIRGLIYKPRKYLRTWTARDRGMSKWHDIVDWVGGYPFEVAKPDQVFHRVREHGFELIGLTTVRGSSACNEFVFRRTG